VTGDVSAAPRRRSVPLFRTNPLVGGVLPRPSRQATDWHRSLPGYAVTPLHDLRSIAAAIGLDHLWVKDETRRFGLPAFKILGVSWATEVVVARHGGPITRLVAATDGNHGRAVAMVARQRGYAATIFVPADSTSARIEAIRAEGAVVDTESPSYDAAVRRAADFASRSDAHVLISDTALGPDELAPRAVIDGYGSMFCEIDEVFEASGTALPDIVAIQIGVGGLAAAAARFLRHGAPPRPFLCGVEPADAGCAFASVGRTEPAQITSSFGSIMVGLNAGCLSAVSWPEVSAACDAFLLIEDDWCLTAMAMLAEAGVPAGETGAAGLAGLLALREFAADRPRAAALAPVRRARSAMVVVTEGRTAGHDDDQAAAKAAAEPVR
jgi:diaminopropionate ammonia-lyase